MHDVPGMDGTGIVTLQSFAAQMKRGDVALIFVVLQPRVIAKLQRAGI